MSTQLQTLKIKFIDSNEKTVSLVINHIKNNIGVQTNFYSEIVVLLKLHLVSPATNAVSEGSASSMRCIKNCPGSATSQKRLNHCMMLSMYKEKTNKANLKNATNVFCEVNKERRRTFSTFCDTHFSQLNV